MIMVYRNLCMAVYELADALVWVMQGEQSRVLHHLVKAAEFLAMAADRLQMYEEAKGLGELVNGFLALKRLYKNVGEVKLDEDGRAFVTSRIVKMLKHVLRLTLAIKFHTSPSRFLPTIYDVMERE